MDLLKKIDEATTRIGEVQRIRSDLEASALAHEEQARKDRRAITEAKKEIEMLAITLQNARVAKSVDDAQAAAKKAQAEAEAANSQAAKSQAEAAELVARLAEKEKQWDAMLADAKAKAEAEAAEKAAVEKPAE